MPPFDASAAPVSPERAALELAEVAAAVVALPARLEWCTQPWGRVAVRVDAGSDETLAEVACRQLEGRNPGPGGIVSCDLQVGGAVVLSVAAQALQDRRWLIVVRDQTRGGGSPIAEGAVGSLSPPTTDVVTGLPDRASLVCNLAERFRRPEPFALLFIDLDGFKRINDSRGHLVGDEALGQAAQRMRASIRERDYIARFGGDEFVVIAERVDSPRALEPLLGRLRDSLQAPLSLGGEPLRVSVSIGAALSVDGYASVEAMLHAADSRMYASRRSGDQNG